MTRDDRTDALETLWTWSGGRSLPIAIAAAGAWALCATPARAQDAQIQKLETEIQRIEAQHEAEIKSLQAEIRQLRRQKPTSVAAAAPPRPQTTTPGQPSPPPPGAPIPALPAKVLMTYDRGYHFGFSDATGDNTIELFGRLHIDTGGYDYKAAPETLDQKGLADGIDLRRARIGVVGNFMTDWHYALVYDFGNTSDSNNPNNALANANSSTSPTTNTNYLAGVENALITYNGFYQHGEQFPVAFDLGVQDVPWTLDEATSSNDIMFMERSSSQVVATEFGGGDFRSAIDLRSNNDRYWVGAFLTGPNSGALHTDGASCNTGTTAVTAGTPCVTSAQMTGLGPQFAVPRPRRLSVRADEQRDAASRRQFRQPVRAARASKRDGDPALRPAGTARRSDLLPQHRLYPGDRRPSVRAPKRRLRCTISSSRANIITTSSRPDRA